jgi:SAM-dependent methyltransferase
MDNFTKVPFTIYNLDLYYIRISILNAIKKTLPQLKGKLLDIGCGKMPYKSYILDNSNVISYIGLDIEGALKYDANIHPDIFWDGKSIPFDSNSFDCTIATEVLEHCSAPEIVLKEIYRVLKPGGVFFFTVPFLWNLHEVPHDEFRYTPFSMERYLKISGFNMITISATGGWHASLAQMIGLWIRRGPMHKYLRLALSYCLKPIINFLIKKDKKLKIVFKEGQMITGLYGTAEK